MTQASSDTDFTEYVHARWARLVRSAVLLGCSEPEAEDVVQTALERCLLNWRKVQRADNRDAYVHRILVNTFTSSRRRRWHTERPVAAVPDGPGPVETDSVDEADAVLRALELLPAEQRNVVVLRFYAHLTEKQTGDALGIPAGTVKSRLSRALATLSADPNLTELRGTR